MGDIHPSELFFQCPAEHVDVERLPDGSIAIYDRRSQSVHSLNGGAAAIWEACARGATLARLESALGDRLGCSLPAEGVAGCIAEMQELGLLVSEIRMPAGVIESSRRALLAAFGAAMPAVLTLTIAEQIGHSQSAGSGGPGGSGGGLPTSMALPTTIGFTMPITSTTNAPVTSTTAGVSTTAQPNTTTTTRPVGTTPAPRITTTTARPVTTTVPPPRP